MTRLELRVPPPLVLAAVALFMWLAAQALPALHFAIPARGLMMALPAVLGAGIGGAAILQFWRAHTTANPMKPHDASTLVTGGIYRLSRNPMYLGDALLLLAWAVWLANVAAFLGVPLFVAYLNRFQIAVEERILEARFGTGYELYRRAVRRWL